MRKWYLAGAAVALAVLIPVVALAVTPPKSGAGALDEQWFRWKDFSSSTSSTSFVDVPGFNNNAVCIVNGVVVNVSILATGAPFQIKVLDTHGLSTTTMLPGPVTVRPGAHATPFSFQWVLAGESNGSHQFDVQWKALGGTSTIRKGTMDILFQDCV